MKDPYQLRLKTSDSHGGGVRLDYHADSRSDGADARRAPVGTIHVQPQDRKILDPECLEALKRLERKVGRRLQPFEVSFSDVDQDWQQRGVGTRMYEEATRWASRHGGALIASSCFEYERDYETEWWETTSPLAYMVWHSKGLAEQVAVDGIVATSPEDLPGTRSNPCRTPSAQEGLVLVEDHGELRAYLLDVGELGQGSLGEALLGQLTMAPVRRRDCPQDLVEVKRALARSGWGPVLYDAALELAGQRDLRVVPDRTEVSPEAAAVWRYYAQNRDDVLSAPSGCRVHGGDLDDAYWVGPRFCPRWTLRGRGVRVSPNLRAWRRKAPKAVAELEQLGAARWARYLDRAALRSASQRLVQGAQDLRRRLLP